MTKIIAKEYPIWDLTDAGRNEKYIWLYKTTMIIIEGFKLCKVKYLTVAYNLIGNKSS